MGSCYLKKKVRNAIKYADIRLEILMSCSRAYSKILGECEGAITSDRANAHSIEQSFARSINNDDDNDENNVATTTPTKKSKTNVRT